MLCDGISIKAQTSLQKKRLSLKILINKLINNNFNQYFNINYFNSLCGCPKTTSQKTNILACQ